MNEVYQKMLSQYDLSTEQKKRNAIIQFNGLVVNQEEFMAMLKEKLASTNINQVKQDVMPFLKNNNELNIWSNDYFLQLTQMIKWKK